MPGEFAVQYAEDLHDPLSAAAEGMTLQTAHIGQDDWVLSVTMAPGDRFDAECRDRIIATLTELAREADNIYVLFGDDVPRRQRGFVARQNIGAYSMQKPEGVDAMVADDDPAALRRALFPQTPGMPGRPTTPKARRPGKGKVKAKPDVNAYFEKRKGQKAKKMPLFPGNGRKPSTV